jgi:uncharacterized protein YlxW (UPF0749 family)
MANKQKKTQKEMYNELLALPNLTEEQKEFLQGRIAQLEKKTTNKKETEQQKNRLRLAQAVYDYMAEGVVYTITDLIKEVPALQEMEIVSNQYVTSLIGLLRDNGLVERIMEKGRAKFVKVETEVEGE